MDKKTNIDRLIQAATKYGYTPEQIQLICDEVGGAAYEQFAQEAERLLSPDEKHDLENIQDMDKVTEELKRLYHEKTGKDALEVVSGYISRHIDEFIDEHTEHVINDTPSASPATS